MKKKMKKKKKKKGGMMAGMIGTIIVFETLSNNLNSVP